MFDFNDFVNELLRYGEIKTDERYTEQDGEWRERIIHYKGHDTYLLMLNGNVITCDYVENIFDEEEDD